MLPFSVSPHLLFLPLSFVSTPKKTICFGPEPALFECLHSMAKTTLITEHCIYYTSILGEILIFRSAQRVGMDFLPTINL